MSISPKDQLKSVARSATAPARNYINNHFEMTKAEVRGLVDQLGDLDQSSRNASILELGNVVAETALYQSRMISQSRSDVESLRSEVAELTALVDQLVGVIGAMNMRDRHPGDPASATGSA